MDGWKIADLVIASADFTVIAILTVGYRLQKSRRTRNSVLFVVRLALSVIFLVLLATSGGE